MIFDDETRFLSCCFERIACWVTVWCFRPSVAANAYFLDVVLLSMLFGRDPRPRTSAWKGHLEEQNSSSHPDIVCLKIQNPNVHYLDQGFTWIDILLPTPLLSFASRNGCPAGDPRKDRPKLGTTSGWSRAGSWGNLFSCRYGGFQSM